MWRFFKKRKKEEEKDDNVLNTAQKMHPITTYLFVAFLQNYSRNHLSSSTIIPDEIVDLVINFGYYFVMSSNVLIELESSSSERIFKLRHAIQMLLKQLQKRFDSAHQVNKIAFSDPNEYKDNNLQLQDMMDISIDFIHDALISGCITRVDIGDFIAQFRYLGYHDENENKYEFLNNYLVSTKYSIYKTKEI